MFYNINFRKSFIFSISIIRRNPREELAGWQVGIKMWWVMEIENKTGDEWVKKGRAVWPYWAIFKKVLGTNFLVNVAQIFGNFLGHFEKFPCMEKLLCLIIG